ncbi:macro domain-containing protein [Pseudomonas aeruginosa]
MIRVLIGDIFQSDAQTLVNTVNCVGVMGKGVALEFKKRWPRMMQDYAERCKEKRVKPGEPYLYSDIFGTSIVNFPTKDHWRSASRLSDIEKGLSIFIESYKIWNVTSVAFPPLGCGNGGLEWEIVGPIMYKMLSKLDIPVEIFAPFGTPPNQLSPDFLAPSQHRLFTESGHKGSRGQKLNPNWLILVEVVNQLEKQDYAPKVGRTIFQKICHAVTALGIETDLDFQRGSYGPFSDEVKKSLSNTSQCKPASRVSAWKNESVIDRPRVRKGKRKVQRHY